MSAPTPVRASNGIWLVAEREIGSKLRSKAFLISTGILMLAVLQGVPEELSEAASIDGASWWQIQRYVTLPLLAPTIRIWAFLSIIGSLQLFDMVWILTGGGPVNATTTMATYMVDYGNQRSQIGYGSAVAVILFVISLIIALAYQRLVLRRDLSGAITRGN